MNQNRIIGMAHVGLPTNNIRETISFYQKLGFDVILETYNEKAKEKVAFLQMGNYCIETFENGQAEMKDGAYQHVALDVTNIKALYKKMCDENYQITTNGIEELPFWKNGVQFFMIKGPNNERIEFCQKL